MPRTRGTIEQFPSVIPEVEPAEPEIEISRNLSYERVLVDQGVYRKGGELYRKAPTASQRPSEPYQRADGRWVIDVPNEERQVAMTLADAQARNWDYYHPGGPLIDGGPEVGAGWYRWGRKRELDYPANLGLPKQPYLTDTVEVPAPTSEEVNGHGL